MRTNNYQLSGTGNIVLTAAAAAIAILLAVPAVLLAVVPFVG